MSGYHAIAGDVDELDDADEANDLIAGDPEEILESLTAMAKLGEAMSYAGEGLAAVDTGDWTGQAADAFRTRIDGKPKQWYEAGKGLVEISEALAEYRVVLVSAQAEAGRALTMWRGAQDATKKAADEHNQRVKTYNAAIDAGQNPAGPLPVFHDPGEAGRKQAQSMLEDARRRVTDAGHACGRVISEWIGRAPAEPDWWKRLGMNAADAVDAVVTGYKDLAEGAFEAVVAMGKMARTVNPFDPYNLTHPQEYAGNMKTLAAGVWNSVQHPKEIGKALIDLDTWRDSPAKAIGKLFPDVVLGVATGGSALAGRTAGKAVLKAAADSATGGLLGLGELGVAGTRKIGSMLGRDAGRLGREAAEDAGKLGRNTSDELPWHHAERYPDTHVDHSVAGTFEQIGKSLGDIGGNLRQRIDDLSAWATSKHPDATVPSSVRPTTPPAPPVRQPPQVGQATPPPNPVPRQVEPPTVRPAEPPAQHVHPVEPPAPSGQPYKELVTETSERIKRSTDDLVQFRQDMANRWQAPDQPGSTIAERLTPDVDVPHDRPHTGHQPDQPHTDGTPGHSADEPAPHPVADNPDVRADVEHSAAVPDIDLHKMPEDLVWRTTDEPLYRVESGREMEDLFENGLEPKERDLSNFDKFVLNNERSGWVSTTTDPDLWRTHALYDPDNSFVLEIDARGGVDVEASRPDDYRILQAEESEIAFPGGVARERIKGGFFLHVDPATGSKTRVPGSWVDNPHYIPNHR